MKKKPYVIEIQRGSVVGFIDSALSVWNIPNILKDYNAVIIRYEKRRRNNGRRNF